MVEILLWASTKDTAGSRSYSAVIMPDAMTPAAGRLGAVPSSTGPSSTGPTPRENPRDVDRENSVLRELVTVYRHLSGLAMQDADLAGVVQLISERAQATVA